MSIWSRLFDQLRRQNSVVKQMRADYRRETAVRRAEYQNYASAGLGPCSYDYPIYCRQCGYQGPASSSQPFSSQKDVYGNPGRMCPECGSLLQTQYYEYGGHTDDPFFPDQDEE